MAQAAKQVKEDIPTTVIKGKTVQVVGTKGGAISTAQAQAKAARLKGSSQPSGAGKYGPSQSIRVLPAEEGEGGNPHRVGTYRHKAFEACLKAKTVADYAKSGFKPKYLERWVKMGLVRIS